MVESAAHLIDHVLPEQPIRQMGSPPPGLTFPYPLRYLFAAQPDVLSRVLGVVYRAISTFLIKQTGCTVASGVRSGAVTLIQHPIMGTMRRVKAPAQFSGERLDPASASPANREHTDDVLRELGRSDEEIAALVEAGVAAPRSSPA